MAFPLDLLVASMFPLVALPSFHFPFATRALLIIFLGYFVPTSPIAQPSHPSLNWWMHYSP
jgi:hypothetical protein